MARATTASAVRGLLLAAGVAAIVLLVVQGGRLAGGAVPAVVPPFLAGAVAAVGLHLALPRTLPARAGRGSAGQYPALAEAARRMQSGTLEEVLPGLAQVVAEGTGAARAEVWLAVGDRLMAAARHPPAPGAGEELPGLAALLTRPDTDHVVPVLDGTVLRAALAIAKPAAVTAADRQLMQDVANGAGLLLRVVALNVELADRVQRAADLAEELQASRGRLATARDVERRRLVAELAYATAGRLDTLRAEIAAAAAGMADPQPEPGRIRADLARARDHLDDLLDRFRAVARGVYPSVLRDHGPAAALDEVVADLPRGVRLTGGLGERLPWELESGLYYVAAAAVRVLAERPADTPLVVRLERAGGRIGVVVEDTASPVPPHRLAVLLADDADRLAALGGGMDVEAPGGEGADDPRRLVLHAWLPDRVEPVVVDATGPQVAVR